jgi:cell division septation protein DedD
MPGAPPAAASWTLSFATLIDQDRARMMAREISVEGRTARVLVGDRDGAPIFRVLLGPYDSREAAERAGMLSGRAYWVFEGTP